MLEKSVAGKPNAGRKISCAVFGGCHLPFRHQKAVAIRYNLFFALLIGKQRSLHK